MGIMKTSHSSATNNYPAGRGDDAMITPKTNLQPEPEPSWKINQAAVSGLGREIRIKEWEQLGGRRRAKATGTIEL